MFYFVAKLLKICHTLGISSMFFCIFARMKIFTSTQLKELDQYTIAHEPIGSIDLMERAAKAMKTAIEEHFAKLSPFVVFASPGNNGGDALAVARLLAEDGYEVSVYLFNVHDKLSADCLTNKRRLAECKHIKHFTEVRTNFDPPLLDEHTVVVDGLFGNGINKPLSGGFASLVKYINRSAAKVVSLDIPSGLMPEDNTYNVAANIIRADLTLTLHQKKLAMLFADMQPYLGEVRVLDIRLSAEFIEQSSAHYETVEENDIRPLLKTRDAFAHKGSMGNALLVAGSLGMAGAAVLAAKACFKTGAGKVTVRVPQRLYEILQISVPEALVSLDNDEYRFTESVDTHRFNAVGIGSGLGLHETTATALIGQIRRTQCPLVLDADALNIFGTHRAWLQQLPRGVIMTPHPKELERLTGVASSSGYEQLAKALELAERLEAYILLKGHYTALCLPEGQVLFNTTGNAGMATAGSGDVLTGIITGLLARGYAQREACLLGMYLHGLAGDLAAREIGQESLTASDIIAFIPQAFKRLND